VCDLQQAVRQGAFTVINVGNDAKVADVLHKGCKDKHGGRSVGYGAPVNC
jgi:hypothetical protein